RMVDHMYRYIKGYMNDIQALLDSGGYNDIEQLKREFLIKLEFFKHERLVHLIVTFMVINAMFICFAIFSTTLNSGFGIISLIMLVLVGCYLAHYYFLENSVQKMYRMYDRMNEISQRAQQ
ncbi:MAG: hypothetical protein II664_03530, partial [Oscillospiraceae bacterium]|nr:hypothetical protein [Oscillospiraceae bacterium]